MQWQAPPPLAVESLGCHRCLASRAFSTHADHVAKRQCVAITGKAYHIGAKLGLTACTACLCGHCSVVATGCPQAVPPAEVKLQQMVQHCMQRRQHQAFGRSTGQLTFCTRQLPNGQLTSGCAPVLRCAGTAHRLVVCAACWSCTGWFLGI